MKKRDKEELASKSVIFTIIFLVIMLCTTLVQKAYFKVPPTSLSSSTPKILLVSSITLLAIAVVFVILGFIKNQKYFEASAWTAGLATFSMLLKINYEIKGLEFTLPNNFFILPSMTVKFYYVMMCLFVLIIVAIWVRTVVKLIKD